VGGGGTHSTSSFRQASQAKHEVSTPSHTVAKTRLLLHKCCCRQGCQEHWQQRTRHAGIMLATLQLCLHCIIRSAHPPRLFMYINSCNQQLQLNLAELWACGTMWQCVCLSCTVLLPSATPEPLGDHRLAKAMPASSNTCPALCGSATHCNLAAPTIAKSR
jgi:hypothetical protein